MVNLFSELTTTSFPKKERVWSAKGESFLE